MSHLEFNQLLESVAALSPAQVQQLRRKLDSRPAVSSPPAASAFEALSRAGVIGCIEGLPGSPTDLSTNPDHMQDFGRD